MRNKRLSRKTVWIGLGFLAILLRQILVYFPEVVEQLYSRGLFLGVRCIIDYLLGWIPIPLMYLFWTGLLVWVIFQFRKLWKAPMSLKQKSLSLSTGVLAFIGAVIFFFLFLWGFNYIRQPIEDQIGIKAEPLELEALKEEFLLETALLEASRAKIPGLGDSVFTKTLLPDHLESVIRKDLESWLKKHDFPTIGRVRGRILYPKGIFLRFSSLGLYFPLTGEGHVDAGIHPVQLPSVLAHEMSHGYGFGDEGTCNFLAYLSCKDSEDPAIAYTGRLGYWRTLAGNYRRYDPEGYGELFEKLNPGVKADLYAIRDNYRKYPDIMPQVRNAAYESYLKAQGIKEGMKNYSRVIMLVKAWRERE